MSPYFIFCLVLFSYLTIVNSSYLQLQPGQQCSYNYDLEVHVHRGQRSTKELNFKINIKVDAHVVERHKEDEEYYVTFIRLHQPRVIRTNNQRSIKHVVDHNLEEKLSKPFYFLQNIEGKITDVFYPNEDSPDIIGLKKGVVSAFNVRLMHDKEAEYHIKEEDDSGIHVSYYNVSKSGNSSHMDLMKTWTSDDYIKHADGRPIQGKKYSKSHYHSTIKVEQNTISKVLRTHQSYLHDDKPYTKPLYHADFQHQPDFKLKSSGDSQLHLIRCSQTRIKRRSLDEHVLNLANLKRDTLTYGDMHRLNWASIGNPKKPSRSFYELLRCYSDTTVKESELSNCVKELHFLARTNPDIHQKIVNLTMQRSHQNFSSWSALVGALVSRSDYNTQRSLAIILLSNKPRELTKKEHEAVLEAVYFIPHGPLYPELFHALLSLHKNQEQSEEISVRAMLVLSALTKRCHENGYNMTLLDDVMQHLHHSFKRHPARYHDHDSHTHESYLRRHIWAFGNLGHSSILDIVLPYLDHDNYDIRYSAVSALRKLQPEQTDHHLLRVLATDDHVSVKAGVIGVLTERRQNLTTALKEAIEDTFWKCEEEDELDSAITELFENHGDNSHQVIKQLRKKREVIKRKKRALIPALKPREFTFGVRKEWRKGFGGKRAGAEALIRFLNEVTLRIGIFGGKFEINLDNLARIRGHVFVWSFDIVKGKAAFKLAASFKNDLPKDLIHSISDTADDILAQVDSLTSIFAKHIQNFIDKLRNYLPLRAQPFLDFISKVVDFLAKTVQTTKFGRFFNEIVKKIKNSLDANKLWNKILDVVKKLLKNLAGLTGSQKSFKGAFEFFQKLFEIVSKISSDLPRAFPIHFDISKFLEHINGPFSSITEAVEDYFKSLGFEIPDNIFGALHFRNTLRFSISMDRLKKFILNLLKFGNDFIKLVSVFRDMIKIDIPRLQLPDLSFPSSPGLFDFDLSFDWRIRLNFNVDFAASNFGEFKNLFKYLAKIFKILDAPHVDLGKFFKLFLPRLRIDLSKIDLNLFKSTSGLNIIQWFREVIRRFQSRLDQQDKNLLDLTNTVEFLEELAKKIGAFSKKALKKVCKFQGFMLKNAGTLKDFGENLESDIVTGIKKIEDETQIVIEEVVNVTLFIDNLIDEVQRNLSKTTKTFVDNFLTKLEDSLENVKDVADNIAEFADNSTSKLTGFCFKTADITGEILDDIQDEAEKAVNELASFITTNSAGITPLLTRFKQVINNVEKWYQNNLEKRLGKYANVADTLEEFLSLLKNENKFWKDVHKVSSNINDVIEHLQNLPEHAQKARDSADKVQEFATNANAWLKEFKKINIRRKFKIDFDEKIRKLCNEFQVLAKSTTKKVQGDELFKTFRTFVTKETDKLISRVVGKLNILKEPVQDVRKQLEKVSETVTEVESVLTELKPFSKNFSPILVTLLPNCSEIEIIFDNIVTKCWNGTITFGKQAYGEYQDLKSQVGALLVLIPDEWENLSIRKCIKGGTCISEAFLKQAKDVAGKIKVLQKKFENKEMFESLQSCKDSVEEVTKVINRIKNISTMVEEFTLKDEMQKIEELSRHITGKFSDETTVKKRSIKDLGSKVKNLAEHVKRAMETKEKVEKLVKDVFQKLQDIYKENIEPFKNNLKNVKEKLELSQELAKKSGVINPSLQAVETVVASMTEFTGVVQNIVDPLEGTVLDVFAKTSEFTDIFDDQLKKYGDKVKQVSDEINGFLDKITSFLNKIQIRQKGLDIRDFKPWDQYNYCSQHVCIRLLRRSSKLYLKTIFVWKYPHLDDLSSLPNTGKWLVPGLFDDYKIRSIAQLSGNQMLLGMKGVAANTDKPSLLVVVDISSANTRVSKIFQIQESGTSFTGDMTGVIIIPSSYIWISSGDKLYALRLSDLTNALSSSTPTTINVIKSKSFSHQVDSVSYDKKENEIWIVDSSRFAIFSYSVAPFGNILSQRTQLQTGENTRSVTMIRQFGIKYACVAKCALIAGYQCKLEFHSLDSGVLDDSTLHRVVRTPTGLEAVQTIADGTSIITAFSSGTYSEKDKIERIAGDFEDRFFRLKLPILSTKFSIYENCLYLRVGRDWIIPERRLFAIGNMICGSRRKRSALEQAMETDIYSEELEQQTEHHKRMRRQVPESLDCVWNIEGEPKRGSYPFIPEVGVTIPVFGIPVYFFFGADGHYYVNWRISLCLRDKQVKLGLIPGAWVTVYAGASLVVLIVEAGVTVEAKLIETYLVPELAVRVDKWPLDACVELRMQSTPLSIRVYLWYRFRLCIKIRIKKWFKIRIQIRWCRKKTFAEWSWSTRTINKKLFSNCKKEIDSSPPVTGECTAKQVGNKRYYVQWHGFTEDTKIQHYIVTVGSVRKSGDDHYSILNVQQSLVISDLDIMHGRNIYVSVAALNGQGLKSYLAECPVFTAKRRSPVVTFINDGKNTDDIDYRSDDTRLSMSYGLKENLEEILRVQWGISSSPECTLSEDEADVLSLRDIGDRFLVTKTGMDLKNGAKYYTRVVVINLLGLATVACSDGVTIDTTPPLPQTFIVGKFIPSTRRVKGEFESFLDNESPMINYEWKLVDEETGNDVTSFETIPLTQRQPLIDDVNLIPGKSYTAVLRGTNAADLTSTVNISGIIPDNSRAVCMTPVADVLDFGSVDDEDFVSELSNLTAFFDCDDEESGIQSIEAAIGSFPGGANIYEFVNIKELVKEETEQGTWILFSQINITSLVRYYVTIRIKNGVAFTTTLTSDGILMDTTPPNVLPSYIRDGCSGVDKKFSNSSNTFPVHWENAFTDAESGISEYFVGLGTTPGSDDQLVFTSYGEQQRALISGVTLESGVVYYVTVIGCNGVRMCVNGTSNGALVDFVPPHTGLVKSGNEGPPVKVTWINKAAWARWNWCSADKNNQPLTSCGYDSFYDTHSGIKYFGLSVLSYDTAELLVPIKTVGRVVLSGRHVFLPNGVFSVLVEAEDRAGVRSNALSESFIIDSTPPIITTLHHGHQDQGIVFTRSAGHTFTAHIEITEDVSHIISYSVGVGSYAGADDVISLVTYTPSVTSNIINVDWTASSETTLQSSRKYFITVKATNSAGLFLIAASQHLIFDNEVPRVGRVLDGWGTQDAQYHAFSSIYRIHWQGIKDYSGIKEIEVCLSSNRDKNNCDLYSRKKISTKVFSYSFTNLTLKTGDRCYGLLHLVDNAGNFEDYWTDGTLIDLTAPNMGKVVDGDKHDVEYQSETNILHASWSGFTENETMIHHYELAFGTDKEKMDIQPFTDVGLVESAPSSNLVVAQLQNGVVYFAHVIAYNILGVASEKAVSNGVLVESTPPNFIAPVSDGNVPTIDGDYTTTKDSLSTTWKCNDKESGLKRVCVAFGTQPGIYDVLSFKDVLPYQTSFTLNNVSLLQGFKYFATVKCINKVSLHSSSSSNGITFDSTPPSLSFVNNGLDSYKSSPYFALNNSLNVNWKFSDPESHIKSYQVSINKHADDATVIGPVNLPGNQNFFNLPSSNNDVKHGERYYFIVAAENGAGLTAMGKGGDFIVDGTPPQCFVVYGATLDGQRTRFSGQSNKLSVFFECDDEETTISSFQFAIKHVRSNKMVLPFHTINTISNITSFAVVDGSGKVSVDLKSGEHYQIGVKVINQVLLTNDYWTGDIIIDLTPPMFSKITSNFDVPSESIKVSWQIKDDESGIQALSWTLNTIPDADEPGTFTSISSNTTELEISGITLTLGQTYYVYLQATNEAGLSSMSVSDGVVIDRTPPLKGEVSADFAVPVTYDGNPNVANGASFPVKWTGFRDGESGIRSYDWVIVSSEEETKNIHDDLYTIIPFVGTLNGYVIKNQTVHGNITYFACIRVTNGAGLQTSSCSKPVLVQLGRLTAGIIYDGLLSEDVDFQLDDKAVRTHWEGFEDPIYGLEKYEWCYALLSEENGANCSTTAVYPPLKTSAHQFHNVSLTHGQRYGIKVVATNKRDQTISANSDGFTVDRTAPVTGIIKIGGTHSSGTIYLTSMSPPSISWTMNERESELRDFEVSIGSLPRSADLLSLSGLDGKLRNVNLDEHNFDIVQGMSFFVTVVGVNVVGLASSMLSSQVIVDLTPALVGKVYDGNEENDIDYQLDDKTLTATWSEFSDPESGIDEYLYCIGTIPDVCDVTKMTSVMSDLRMEVKLQLIHGTTYFVTVKAVNNAGLSITTSSNGITIDVTPPIIKGFKLDSVISIAEEVAKVSADVKAISTNPWSIMILWDAINDKESGIETVSLCVGTNNTNCGIKTWFNVNVAETTSITIRFPKQLNSGEVFVVGIKATNRAGLEFVMYSNIVLTDISPPVQGVVTVNNDGKMVFLKDDIITFKWKGFEDRESGVKHYQWKICSMIDRNICISEFVEVNDINSLVIKDTGLQHGVEYNIVMKAVNFAGLECQAISNSFMLDKTFPEAGIVLDGSVLFEDRQFQSETSQIRGVWNGFKDKESCISHYEVCVGTRRGLCDIAEYLNVALQTTGTITNLNLTHNTTYYTTVKATNKAGLSAIASSDGILLDTTSPVGGELRDGDDDDEDITNHDTFVAMNWDDFHDPESDVVNYVICAGSTRGACDILPEITTTELSLTHQVWPNIASGTMVFSTLKVYNKAGGKTTIHSDGILIDSTQPDEGKIFITSAHEVVGVITYVTQKDGLCFSWSDFNDAETRVLQYEYSLCSTGDNVCFIESRNVGVKTSECIDVPDIIEGQEYFIQVSATNQAGLQSIAHSPLFVVDISEPDVGEITVSNPLGDQYQFISSGIVAQWTGFIDFESGIKEYFVCIGTQPGLCDIVGETAVGNDTDYQWKNLDLIQDQQYFVFVKAENNAGKTTNFTSSSPINVDNTAVDPVVISDGPSHLEDIDYQKDNSYVKATWFTIEDPESGVTDLRWCVGSQPRSCDLREERTLKTDETSVSGYLTPLSVGKVFFVTVLATNGAGGVTSMVSNGVLIDYTPPSDGTVILGDMTNDYIDGDNNILRGRWFGFNDLESGIKSYEFALCEKERSTVCPQPFSGIGLETNVTISGTKLSSAIEYVLIIRAQNMVGLNVDSSSNSITFDTTPPIAGHILIDGTQYPNHRISARWDDFIDAESSIRKYEICLGTTESRCETKSFEDVGMKKEYTFSDISLIHKESYYVTVKAVNNVGLSVLQTSEEIFIDLTPPTLVQKIKGSSLDIDKKCSDLSNGRCNTQKNKDDGLIEIHCVADLITVKWLEYEDEESGMAKIQWCVETLNDTCNVRSWTTISETLQTISAIIPSLAELHAARVLVEIYNGVGNYISLKSPSCYPQAKLPPQIEVKEVAKLQADQADIDYQSKSETIFVMWSLPRNNPVGYSKIQAALTTPTLHVQDSFLNTWNGESFVYKFVDIPLERGHIVFKGEELKAYTKYHTVVRLWNTFGVYTDSVSDGIIIVPDFPPAIHVGTEDEFVGTENKRWESRFNIPNIVRNEIEEGTRFIPDPFHVKISTLPVNENETSLYDHNIKITYKTSVYRVTPSENETRNDTIEEKVIFDHSHIHDDMDVCCTKNTKRKTNHVSPDKQFKPVTKTNAFGSSVATLNNNLIAVSSKDTLFILSEKEAKPLHVKRFTSSANNSYVRVKTKAGKLIVSSGGKVIMFKQVDKAEIRVQCYFTYCTSTTINEKQKCDGDDAVWSTKENVGRLFAFDGNDMMIISGNSPSNSNNNIGVFQQQSSSLTWNIVQILNPRNDSSTMANIVLNKQFLIVLFEDNPKYIVYNRGNKLWKRDDKRSEQLYSITDDPKSIHLTEDGELFVVSAKYKRLFVIDLSSVKTKCTHSISLNYVLTEGLDVSGKGERFAGIGVILPSGSDGIELVSSSTCSRIGGVVTKTGLRFDDGNSGVIVSLSESRVILANPTVYSWSSDHVKTGTGRLYITTFCGRNFIRKKMFDGKQQTIECIPCGDGEQAYAGFEEQCVNCSRTICIQDSGPFNFRVSHCEKYPCSNDDKKNGEITQHVMKDNLTITESAPNSRKDAFYRTEAAESYFIRISQLSEVGVETISDSFPFSIDTTSPEPGFVYDGMGSDDSKNCSANTTFSSQHQCSSRSFSDTDLDFTNDTSEISARWIDFRDNESNIENYFWCIGSQPLRDDIMQCENTTGYPNKTITGLSLKHKAKYYITVVTCNYAGLCTAKSSDGVLVDTTPPVIHYVRDGLIGPDINFQVFTNALFGNWYAEDPESGIIASEIGWGSSPGLDDIWEFQEVGNVSAWYVPFKDGLLGRGNKYYLTVKVINGAGLESQTVSSDGIVVGKSEFVFNKNDTGSFFFDTVDVDSNETKKDSGIGNTYGTLEVPSGAVDNEVKFICESLSEKSMTEDSNATLVDPKVVKPPKKFKLGNYSFQITAYDPLNNGTELAEYHFKKPITITLVYDVDQMLKNNREVVSNEVTTNDIDPVLLLWDIEKKKWYDAAKTCPEPWSFVDRDAKLLKVNVCHLTQFALFWLLGAEHGIIEMQLQNGSTSVPSGHAVYDSDNRIIYDKEKYGNGMIIDLVRRKGSLGNIQVNWAVSMKPLKIMIVSPSSGQINMTERQWHASINLTFLSMPTKAASLFVTLTSVSGGAILGNVTTSEILFLEKINTPKKESNQILIIVLPLVLGIALLVTIIIGVVCCCVNRQKKHYRSENIPGRQRVIYKDNPVYGYSYEAQRPRQDNKGNERTFAGYKENGAREPPY